MFAATIRQLQNPGLPMSAANKSLKEFIDPSFFLGKRPAVPGGAWPINFLEKKSFQDLQQLWFTLLKEKNMLLTMQRHYQVHAEDLGAFPAPSRVKMVDESMANIKSVMRARDEKATAAAKKIFEERLKKGVYRYPAGPQPPAQDNTSTIVFQLDKHVSEDRIRELFGRYDVYDDHKGIARIDVTLSQEALNEKEKAERDFDEWHLAKEDFEMYKRYENINSSKTERSSNGEEKSMQLSESTPTGTSFFDSHQMVELAPGVYLEQPLMAAQIPIPEPATVAKAPKNALERVKFEQRSWAERQPPQQLTAFPYQTSMRPAPPGDRPTHPDEIDGPWDVKILYDTKDGAKYAMELGIVRIDDADIVNGQIKQIASVKPNPAATCPLYREALRIEEADQAHQMDWPITAKWKDEYYDLAVKPLHEIVRHNWTNVAEYISREALMTGESFWGLPIDVDPSCGDYVHIPPHAEPPKSYLPDAMEQHEY